MKITRDTINHLYRSTCAYANGYDIDALFEGKPQPRETRGSTNIYDVVYEILGLMGNWSEYGFGVILIHSDGGIRDYMVTYQKGDYKVLVSREEMFSGTNNWPTSFDSVQHFIDWLNNHADKINSIPGEILPMSKSEIKKLDDVMDRLKMQYASNFDGGIPVPKILNFDNDTIHAELNMGTASRYEWHRRKVAINRKTMEVMEVKEPIWE